MSKDGLCECGCGTPTRLAPQSDTKLGWVKGQPIRFVQHHSRRGLPHKSYKKRGYECEHSLIAARALGRPLAGTEEVHHVDGDITSNRRGNLVICPNRAYHLLLHARTRIVRAGGNPNTEKICSVCRRLRPRADFTASSSNKTDGRGFHCSSCRRAMNKVYVRPSLRVGGVA